MLLLALAAIGAVAHSPHPSPPHSDSSGAGIAFFFLAIFFIIIFVALCSYPVYTKVKSTYHLHGTFDGHPIDAELSTTGPPAGSNTPVYNW